MSVRKGASADATPTRTDCPTCGYPVTVRSDSEGTSHYVALDEDAAGAELSRIESDLLEIHDALVDIGLDGAINAESIVERVHSLRSEFIVCFAAGYPDPHSPWPNTLENAQRFAREHRVSGATGKPVDPAPLIKRRVVSGWKDVDVD